MEMQVREEDDVVNVRLTGGLDFQDHMQFNDFINTLQGQKKQVIFDLSALDTIDSAGIGMLFLAQKVIEKSHGELTLTNPTGQVKRVFEITSIGKQITIS